jgi:dihydrofolate synthase/folylpolyglutamate synthase
LANVRKNTGFAGRWQTIGSDPLTIVDVGHNEDGLRTVKDMLARTRYDRLHIVLGTVNDKDLTRMLAQLPRNATYYFCKADIPRGLEAEKLAHLAESAGLHGTIHESVAAALAAARFVAGMKDLVLVSGSIFTVAEVL